MKDVDVDSREPRNRAHLIRPVSVHPAAPLCQPSLQAAIAGRYKRLPPHHPSPAASIIGHVPRGERSRWASALSGAAGNKLKTAVAAWYGASALSPDAFRTQLLGPYTSNETVDLLRRAARGMVEARSYAELGKAGEDLATAATQVGADRWTRYLADANRRVTAAVSDRAIPGAMQVGAADADLAAIILGGLIMGGVLYGASRSSKPTPATTPHASTDPNLPIIVEAVPVPPPREGETPADVLKPDGRLVGQAGSSADIRELPGGEGAAQELFDRLTKGGTDMTPSDYPGKRVRLPNGDIFGYRESSTSGSPTIDVKVGGLSIGKLKFPGR